MEQLKFRNNTLMNNTISHKILLLLKKYQYIVLLGVFGMIITLISIGIISTHVSAKNESSRQKSVVSVKIEKGDTLWSIAKEYMSDEYKDIHTYIKEIKKSNGLSTDTIHEGCYIIVPYYTAKR